MILKFEIVEHETHKVAYFTFKGNETYDQRIKIENKELTDWNCTCKFGSVWRFSKKNMESGATCKHIIEALGLLKYLKHIN